MRNELADLQQITDVLVRYATSIDSRDWSLFRTCFTERCALDYGDIGGWDGREAVARFMEYSHSGPSLHRLSNFAITLDGDRARSRTYVDAVVYGPVRWFGAQSTGYYDDQLVRTTQGWQIAERLYVGVRVKFIGVMSFLPSILAARLAAIGARRMDAAVRSACQQS